MTRNNDKRFTVCIWGIVALFTGLYISLLFNHNIWTDEAFTLELLHENVKGIITGTAKDVHPPLYYLYAKIFYTVFGDALIVQKAAAMIPMTAVLVFGATVMRKKFGDMVSLLFLLFITCVPCSMEFAVQVRMYSLALLCVTVCGVYAYLAFAEGEKKDFVIMAVSGVAAAYTHYFAFVSVIIIVGFLLLAILIPTAEEWKIRTLGRRKNARSVNTDNDVIEEEQAEDAYTDGEAMDSTDNRNPWSYIMEMRAWRRGRLVLWCAAAVGMLVMYAPWMPFFIKQVTAVQKGYWIPEITAETIWKYFIWTFDLTIVPGVVFLFLVILKGASTYNTIKIAKYQDEFDFFALLCMLVPTITMILGVVISCIKTPIYRDQYVFPSLGLLALFFGISMRDAKRWLLGAISAFLLLVGAGQYKECFHQEYRSTYVPQTEAFFAKNLQEDDFIVYNWDIFGFIYKCYFPEEQLVYLPDFDFSQEFRAVWVLDTEWNPDVDPAVLEANGLQMELMGHYGIEHNEFDIYKIYKK